MLVCMHIQQPYYCVFKTEMCDTKMFYLYYLPGELDSGSNQKSVGLRSQVTYSSVLL